MSELKKECKNCLDNGYHFGCVKCYKKDRWKPKIIIQSETENLKIYKKAIATFGNESQINIAIEEMSELTKELCKRSRGRDNKAEILEEIADVYIMMHQLTLMFDNDADKVVLKNIDAKTKRLEVLIVK